MGGVYNIMAQANGATHRARVLACPESDKADITPPRDLSGKAKQFWVEHAPGLQAADMLSPQDKDSFSLLCKIWEMLDYAHEAALEDPKAKLRQYLDLIGRYQALAKCFCLLPIDRKKYSISYKSQLDMHDDKESFDF